MKQLKDYIQEINKCSQCGLCQAVCPLFRLTGNECTVSRGKFAMLYGVVKGDLKLSKTINKYLEMCLKCGKCKDFCPSGIDACEIFRTAKYEYLQNNFEGKLIKFIESEHIFDKIINMTGELNKPENLEKKESAKANILFFRGCANKLIPKSERSLRNIMAKLPYNLLDAKFKCCGVPFASSGNLERYEEVLNYNKSIIDNTEHDFIITDCASCADTLSKISSKKVLNFVDFIAEENIEFEFKKHYKVTFHKPCHLKNYENIKRIFKNCTNIEYVEMPEYDECCGFSGQFAITNRKLSKQLLQNKVKNVISVQPDIVITSCPSCLMGLKLALKSQKTKKIKILNLTEFLELAEIIN